jgi:hypothetical protein
MALAPQVSAIDDPTDHSCDTRFSNSFSAARPSTEQPAITGAKPLAQKLELSARGFKVRYS